MVNHPGQLISIHNVAEIVCKSYPQAFAPRNILSGFNVTGIWPFNPNNFTEEDFLCSYVTDHPLNVSTPAPSTTANDSETLGTSSTAANISPETKKLPTQGSTVDEGLISPHIIRPFPKAPPRKTKGGRKRGYSMIATSTPEKIRIQEKEDKQNNKGTKVSKPKRSIAFSETKNDSDDDSDTIQYDDTSEYESRVDEENSLLDTDVEDLNIDDFVLVKFKTKKTRILYVGKVITKSRDQTNDTVFDITFPRREKPTAYSLIFPQVEDTAEIPLDQIIGKLPKPTVQGGTARVARHFHFDLNLTSFSNELR
ncbi:pogo transposable element with krab domain [Plakobranchus ocellatus]|uniref:Pogo transposable element with krab domain n=1 Tax=Plakobranchus ocellatus TaxID=259542 RepID=A0AAV4DSN8_9GAST|nr:pogo transposable element with krab domain [Plakobranchus ocellatus]